jgi:hypothetical protein
MIERYGKGSWIVRYGSESLVGEDQYDLRENWTRQKYNWWSFYALLKHIRVLGLAHVKEITQESICATTTLLSKGDNNYS